MEKKDLVFCLDKIFQPIGFVRKGNYWFLESKELIKVINLQKSTFGNQFYINYGFIIKGLELNTQMHIQNRLAGSDLYEKNQVSDLFNLEIIMEDEVRLVKIESIIKRKVIFKLEKINKCEDVLNELKGRKQINDIPVIVRNYLGL